METINPNRIRSGMSGMIYGFISIISITAIQCLVARLFGSKYQYLKEVLIVCLPTGIFIGFIGGMIRNKRTKISIQEFTIAQDKLRVTLKSAKCKNILFGITVYDDVKHHIRCTKFNFTREEIDRLKQIIEMRTIKG